MKIFPDIEIDFKHTTYEGFRFKLTIKTNVRRKVNDLWYLIPVKKDSYINDEYEQYGELQKFIKTIWVTYLSPFYNNEKNLFYVDKNQDDEWDRLSKILTNFELL